MSKKKNPVKRYFDFCVELPSQFRHMNEKTATQEKIEKLLSEIVHECSGDMFLPSYHCNDGRRNLAMILKALADRIERESRAGLVSGQQVNVTSGCGEQLEDFISRHVFWEKIYSLEAFSRAYFEQYGRDKSYSLAPYVERLRQHAPLFHRISQQAKFIALEKEILLRNSEVYWDPSAVPYIPFRGITPRNVALWGRMGIHDVNVSIFYELRSCFWQGSFEELERLGDVFLEVPDEMFFGCQSVVSFFEANIDVISGFRDWISANSERGFFRREAISVIEDLGLEGVIKYICVTTLDVMAKEGVITKDAVNGLVFFRSSK